MKTILILVYKQSKMVAFGVQETRTCTLTHPKQVTVWCGFWSRSIIGPFLFENEQGVAVAVNGDRYRAMLNKFIFTKIEK